MIAGGPGYPIWFTNVIETVKTPPEYWLDFALNVLHADVNWTHPDDVRSPLRLGAYLWALFVK